MLPRRNGEVTSIDAHGHTLNVKRIKGDVFYARIRGTERARWGNAEEISEDIKYFRETGALPREKEGFQGIKTDKRTIPRPGVKVRFEPTAASLALYSKHPPVGDVGRVVQIPVGRRKAHYLPGPGGGLLYVRWEKLGGALGVSLLDVERL